MHTRFSSIVRLSTLAALCLISLSASPAQAGDVYLPTGSYTASGNTHLNDTIYVGMDSLGQTNSAYDGTLHVINSNIFGGVLGYSNGTINISGSLVALARSLNTSTLNIGIAFVPEAYSADKGVINLNNGVVGAVGAANNSTFNMTDGSVQSEANLSDTSTMNISGGSVSVVNAFDSSTLNNSGGHFGAAYSTGNSAMNISGGTITSLWAGGGAVNISGGYFQYLFGTGDQSVINITGWQFKPDIIRLFDFSVLHLTGTGLGFSSSASGTDQYGEYDSYILYGTLANGVRIDGTPLYDYDGGFNVGDPYAGDSLMLHNGSAGASAPEPGTLALLALGVVGFIARRSHVVPGSKSPF